MDDAFWKERIRDACRGNPNKKSTLKKGKKLVKEKAMNVMEIIKDWLMKNNYDGLFSDGECACVIRDLMPCCEYSSIHCEPGYKLPCDCGEHDYHIGPHKPVKKDKDVDQNKTIKCNKAKCKKCGDVIESKHRHDFVSCNCGAISVDGGKDYLKRSGDFDLLHEMSEYE